MSKAERREMQSACEIRKSFGLACCNCMYSDMCEKYKCEKAQRIAKMKEAQNK